MNLKDWRKSKGWRQEDLAEKVGEIRATFQSWESGRSAIPPQIQAKLRKLGFDGAWPKEEAKEAHGVTREEFDRWAGRIERLEADIRALLPLALAVKDLDARVQKLSGARGMSE